MFPFLKNGILIAIFPLRLFLISNGSTERPDKSLRSLLTSHFFLFPQLLQWLQTFWLIALMNAFLVQKYYFMYVRLFKKLCFCNRLLITKCLAVKWFNKPQKKHSSENGRVQKDYRIWVNEWAWRSTAREQFCLNYLMHCISIEKQIE